MQIFGDMMGACVKIFYHERKCGSTTGLVAPIALAPLATFVSSETEICLVICLAFRMCFLNKFVLFLIYDVNSQSCNTLLTYLKKSTAKDSSTYKSKCKEHIKVDGEAS